MLEQVSGDFVNGEVIERDGRVIGTLEAAHSFNLTDSRSVRGRNQSNAIIFGANLLLNDQQQIEASTVTIDQASGQDIVGFKTKMEDDLRPGEVVTATQTSGEGEKTLRILRVDPQNISTTSGNQSSGSPAPVFDYQTQTAKLDVSLTKGSATDGEYGTLVRMRPFVFQKDYQNGEMSIDTPRTSMKSISDESFFVFRTFNNKTVVSGGVTVSLPESEQFATLDNENYILTILGQSGSAYSVGQNLDIDALNDAGTLTVTFGADRQSVTIDGLANVNTVKLTALVLKISLPEKLKLPLRCVR